MISGLKTLLSTPSLMTYWQKPLKTSKFHKCGRSRNRTSVSGFGGRSFTTKLIAHLETKREQFNTTLFFVLMQK